MLLLGDFASEENIRRNKSEIKELAWGHVSIYEQVKGRKRRKVNKNIGK